MIQLLGPATGDLSTIPPTDNVPLRGTDTSLLILDENSRVPDGGVPDSPSKAAPVKLVSRFIDGKGWCQVEEKKAKPMRMSREVVRARREKNKVAKAERKRQRKQAK